MLKEVGKQWRFRQWQTQGNICRRGVGLILDQDTKKCVLGYYQRSDGILADKLKGKYFNIYAPTVRNNNLKKNYCMLDNTKAQCKSQEISTFLGDMNSKVRKERDDE